MTPAQLGYRMPAEWEPHEATWIAWPHNRDDWPGKFAPIPVGLRRDRPTCSAGSRPVHILVSDGARWSDGSSDLLDARRGRPRTVRFFKAAHRPRLAPRLGADFRREDQDRERVPEDARAGRGSA